MLLPGRLQCVAWLPWYHCSVHARRSFFGVRAASVDDISEVQRLLAFLCVYWLCPLPVSIPIQIPGRAKNRNCWQRVNLFRVIWFVLLIWRSLGASWSNMYVSLLTQRDSARNTGPNSHSYTWPKAIIAETRGSRRETKELIRMPLCNQWVGVL